MLVAPWVVLSIFAITPLVTHPTTTEPHFVMEFAKPQAKASTNAPEFVMVKSYLSDRDEKMKSVLISKEQYQFEKYFAESVFVVHFPILLESGWSEREASAFLVSDDLVVTNRHVVDGLPGAQISKFQISLNHSDEKVEGDRLEYCSQKLDFCLVRMKKLKSGEFLSSVAPPLVFEQTSLIQKGDYAFLFGNANGREKIQASSGILLTSRSPKTEVQHCALAFEGNSGSPLFNVYGRVIGVHYQIEDKFKSGCPSAIKPGSAVPSMAILSELKREQPLLFNEVVADETMRKASKLQ